MLSNCDQFHKNIYNSSMHIASSCSLKVRNFTIFIHENFFEIENVIVELGFSGR